MESQRVTKERNSKRFQKKLERTSKLHGTQYLEVELFSCSTKSLKDIQRRVASVHVLRTEITLDEFMCLLLNPTFNFFSERRKKEIVKPQCT